MTLELAAAPTQPELPGPGPLLLAKVHALGLPISAAHPCGHSVRQEPVYDAIREARREDDPNLPTGVWQSALKTADWPVVEELAVGVLSHQGKDLMTVAWLGEAWLNRYGLEGLAAALLLLGNLCERWWAALHPLAEGGDESWRASPLEWLSRTYAGILHAGMPLPGVPAHEDSARATLDQYLAWQRQRTPATDSKMAKAQAEAANMALKKLHDALKLTTWAALNQQLGDLAACKVLLARVDRICSPHMGDDGPSFGGLLRVLEVMEQALRELIALLPAPAPVIPEAQAQGEEMTADPQDPAPQPAVPLRVGGREEAYRQLQAIADYLARTEPHSPVPYLIYRAVEWGNKPLPALLGELLAGDAEARRMWSMLGVLP